MAKRDGCPEIEKIRGLAVLIDMGFGVPEAEGFLRGCEKGLQAYRDGKFKTLGEVMKELEIE